MSDPDNLRRSLEEVEKLYGEPIIAMVVGKHHHVSYNAPPLPDENIILSREVGLAKVDLEYDSGFGGADCFPLFAWTATRVFFVHEYDGATTLQWIPRNPLALSPEFGGQS